MIKALRNSSHFEIEPAAGRPSFLLDPAVFPDVMVICQWSFIAVLVHPTLGGLVFMPPRLLPLYQVRFYQTGNAGAWLILSEDFNK